MTDLEQGKLKYSFKYTDSLKIVESWFLDPKRSPCDTTYEYFCTLNTSKLWEDQEADLMVQLMVQYVRLFNPITYKVCIDLNNKGYYHDHIWMCVGNRVEYQTIRHLWKSLSGSACYVGSVYDREKLFAYMDGHKISRGSQRKMQLSIAPEWNSYYYTRVIYK